MEAQAYADLKSARNAARKLYSPLSDAEKSLKRAITSLTEAGSAPELIDGLTAIRGGVQQARIEAQTAKENLEAQVTLARAEYRQEKVAAYSNVETVYFTKEAAEAAAEKKSAMMVP